MPKLKETQAQKMGRIFRAVVRYGLEMRCEKVDDLIKVMPYGRATIYKRLKDPTTCTNAEMIQFAKFFNDRQLCEFYGVRYCGTTPAAPEMEK